MFWRVEYRRTILDSTGRTVQIDNVLSDKLFSARDAKGYWNNLLDTSPDSFIKFLPLNIHVYDENDTYAVSVTDPVRMWDPEHDGKPSYLDIYE